MPDISYPSIPDPAMDLGSILNSVSRLKETVEMMSGQRGDKRFSFPDKMRSVEARSATSAARFSEQLTVTANSLEAVATRTTTLEVQMGAAVASVITEQTARIAADTALASSITTVDARVNTTQASVVAEQTARINGDAALASSITTVTATANGATASGQVYLIAESAPSGYSAQYGWTLTAGPHSIGMKALVDGSGNGSIAFTANQFKLIDPAYLGGAPVEVFNYNGVTFNFDVPVTIRNQEIGINAVTNTVSAQGMIATSNKLETPNLTVRDGARIEVEAKITDTTASIYLQSFSAAIATRSFNVAYNGPAGNVSIGNVYSMDSNVTANYLGGSSYVFYRAITPASETWVLSGLPAGNYNFQLTNNSGYTLGMSIKATELSR